MTVSKTSIWIGVFLGSTVGGMIPELWGNGMFSFSSVIGSAVGALVGIWAAVKLSYWV
jgi:uncharacterized membrane protein YeaQ/YmgE (transglycosylase-associated protein family)